MKRCTIKASFQRHESHPLLHHNKEEKNGSLPAFGPAAKPCKTFLFLHGEKGRNRNCRWFLQALWYCRRQRVKNTNNNKREEPRRIPVLSVCSTQLSRQSLLQEPHASNSPRKLLLQIPRKKKTVRMSLKFELMCLGWYIWERNGLTPYLGRSLLQGVAGQDFLPIWAGSKDGDMSFYCLDERGF